MNDLEKPNIYKSYQFLNISDRLVVKYNYGYILFITTEVKALGSRSYSI